MSLIKEIGKYYFRKKGHFPIIINGKKFLGDPFHIGFWRIVNKDDFEPYPMACLFLQKDNRIKIRT